jgi:hypothetical protein
MTNSIRNFFALAIIFLLSSCLSNSGIVKRRYEKGFYVEAFGKQKYSPVQKEKPIEVDYFLIKTVVNTDTIFTENDYPAVAYINNSSVIIENKKAFHHKINVEIQRAEQDTLKQNTEKKKAIDKQVKVLEPCSKWSLIFVAATAAVFTAWFFFIFVTIFSQANWADSILTFLGYLFPFMPVLALLLGIIGLFRILKNKDKYKGLGFSIAGIAVGLLVLFLLFHAGGGFFLN